MASALQQLLAAAGATPVEQTLLDDYQKEMREKVIPRIRESEKERLRLAAESRFTTDLRAKRK